MDKLQFTLVGEPNWPAPVESCCPSLRARYRLPLRTTLLGGALTISRGPRGFEMEIGLTAARLTVTFVDSRSSTTVMSTKFTQLNHGWNAEPNAPHIAVDVDRTILTLSFLANPWQFPEFVDGQIIRLRFADVWRYAIGDVNDEGWYRGQCRFSKLAPRWGEFYEVSGDLRFNQFDDEWHIVSEPPANNLRHFLFYFRDETFECDAGSWERIQ